MNDDLDDGIVESDDDGFDEFSQSSNLGDSVRGSPIVKVVIAAVAIAVIIGVVVMFGGSAPKDNESYLSSDVNITSVPGEGEGVATAYKEAVDQQNEADLDKAYEQGGSAIPVPIETRNTRLAIPETQSEVEDPLHRWRLLQEERIEREMLSKEDAIEPVTVLDAEQQSEAVNNLAEAMMQQMQSVLGSTTEAKGFSTRNLISYVNKGEGDNGNGNGGGNGGDGGDGFVEDAEETVIIPAGKIVYGQLLLEANSDIPSAVLVEMVSGPLKGWKLLGSFSVNDDFEMLAITFNLAVNEAGDQYAVNAIMLDPDTSLAAKATDVNHRYFKRIVFPAAAAFIEGFAEAISESGRTTVTVSGTGDGAISTENPKSDEQEVATGFTEAASEISSIIGEMADVPVQIIINSGTPIGIFFTENVVDTEGDI